MNHERGRGNGREKGVGRGREGRGSGSEKGVGRDREGRGSKDNQVRIFIEAHFP